MRAIAPALDISLETAYVNRRGRTVGRPTHVSGLEAAYQERKASLALLCPFLRNAGNRGREYALVCGSGDFSMGGLPRAIGLTHPRSRLSWVPASMCRATSGEYLRLRESEKDPGILLHPDSEPVCWTGEDCAPLRLQSGEERAMLFRKNTVPSTRITGRPLMGVYAGRALLYFLTHLFLDGRQSGRGVVLDSRTKAQAGRIRDAAAELGLECAEEGLTGIRPVPSPGLLELDVLMRKLFVVGIPDSLLLAGESAREGIHQAVEDAAECRRDKRIRFHSVDKAAAFSRILACSGIGCLFSCRVGSRIIFRLCFDQEILRRRLPVPGKKTCTLVPRDRARVFRRKLAKLCPEALANDAAWRNMKADRVRLKSGETFPCSLDERRRFLSPEGLVFRLFSEDISS